MLYFFYRSIFTAYAIAPCKGSPLLSVDLVYFGGSGKELPGTGSIIVDGNAGSYLGKSMFSGAIYVKN